MLASVATGVLLGAVGLQPGRADAANECGAAAPGGSVTCAAPSYVNGITYQGVSGLTVNVASGTAVSNAGGSGAIDLEGTGPLTLNALSASATGGGTGSTFTFSGPNYRHAVYYGVLGYSSTGPVSLNVGQASTTVSGGAAGIGGYSNTGAVSIQATAVQQTGLSAVGINAEGASVSVTSGQIDTTLRGIAAFGDAGGVAISSNTINVTNNSQFFGIGIQVAALSGVGDITIDSGSINASGSSAVGGILAQSATSNGKTTITSGSITAIGDGEYGIATFGASAVDITSTGTITTNGGVRTVSDPKSGGGSQSDPRFAAGIWAVESTNQVSIKNQGSITTSGDTAFGIRVEAGTQATSIPDSSSKTDSKPITITNATIKTSGDHADGIDVLADLSPVSITSDTVKTSGAKADAIHVETQGGAISVTSTDAEASGAGSVGVYAQNSNGGVQVQSGKALGSGAVEAFAQGDVSITSTTAKGLANFSVAGLSLGGKVTIDSGTATSTGGGTLGVAGFAAGDVSITSGTASTSGDVVVGTGARAGTEAVAFGVAGVSQTGSVTIDSTTVSTTGIFAPGIYAQAHQGNVTLTSGTVTTAGAGSRGIFVQANGANITSGSVTTSGAIDTAFAGGAAPFDAPIKTDSFAAGPVAADGIFVAVGSGGATVSSGTVSAASGAGIDVSGGAGAIKITSGTIAAPAGYGITATATTGAITINSTSVNSSDVGLYASTQGAVSITSGSVASPDTGIYAVGSGVTISNTSRIDAGLQGIHAEGGQGGVTINSAVVNVSNGGTGPVNNVYADGINATATGGLISITSADSETTGGTASAIYASNSAGGVAINSGVTKATGVNGSGIVASATGGNVAITSASATGTSNPAIKAQATGTVSIASATASSTAMGIYAVGSGVTVSNTNRIDAGLQGIHAEGGQGGVTINSGVVNVSNGGAGPVDDVYADGINATATGGLISITSTDSETTGGTASAIYAGNSAGGVTINSGVTKATGAGGSGIVASATGGNVAITSASATGTGNPAIKAQATGGAVSITSTTASSTGAAPTIYATATRGTVTINAGTTTATGGNAIYAYQDQTAAVSNPLLQITSASASNSAAATPTIFAYAADRSDIAITVGKVTATGTGSGAVEATALKGNIGINVNGAVESTSGTGIRTGASGETFFTINSGASIVGNVGVIFDQVGSSFIEQFDNHGTITGRSGTAIVSQPFTEFGNFGVINGSVSLNGGGDFGSIGTLNGDLYISGPGSIVKLYTGSKTTGVISHSGPGGTIYLDSNLPVTGSIAASQLFGFSFATVSDGNWVLTGGASALNAAWLIDPPGTLSLANDAALGSGALTLFDGTNVFTPTRGSELQVTATTGGTRTVNIFAGNGVSPPGADIDVVAGATYTLGGVVNGEPGTTLYVNNGGGTGWLVFGRDNRTTLHSNISVFHGGIYAAVTGAFGTGPIQILDPEVELADGVEVANDFDLQTTLQVDQNGGSGMLSGVISESTPGSGLTVTGGGAIVLTGANTYTGTTTIAEGGLAVAGSGSIASSSGVVDNGVLDISASNAGVSIQTLSGSGQVVLGAQTLTLTNGSDTFSGAISGAGGLDITGGVETLTGDNTYSGPTIVKGGALILNGALPNSIVNILDGGSLQGSGAVARIATGSGSVLSPGGSDFGLLALDGDLALGGGSTFEVQVDASGRSDLITVGGKASIAGSKIDILADPGSYARHTTYTILTAAGGVSGTPREVATNLAFLTPTLTFSGTSLGLILSNNGIPFQTLAATPNQAATATALYGSGPTGGALFDAVLMQTDDGARQSFDALSGEIYATAPAVLLDESRYARDQVFGRLEQVGGGAAAGGPVSAAVADSRIGVTTWGAVLGSWARGEAQGSGNTAALSTGTGGLLFGLDGRLATWRAGGAIGWLETKIDLPGRGSRDAVQGTHLIAYAGGPLVGDLKASVGFDHAWNSAHVTRSVTFPGFAEQLASRARGRTDNAFGELGYDLNLGAVAAETYGKLAYVRVSMDGAAESGGASALIVDPYAADAVFSDVGMRFSTSARIGPSVSLQPFAALGWRHLYGDARKVAGLAFGSTSQRFSISGAALDRDAASIQAGLSAQAAFGARLTASYAGQLSGRWQDHQANLALLWAF